MASKTADLNKAKAFLATAVEMMLADRQADALQALSDASSLLHIWELHETTVRRIASLEHDSE